MTYFCICFGGCGDGEEMHRWMDHGLAMQDSPEIGHARLRRKKGGKQKDRRERKAERNRRKKRRKRRDGVLHIAGDWS